MSTYLYSSTTPANRKKSERRLNTLVKEGLIQHVPQERDEDGKVLPARWITVDITVDTPQSADSANTVDTHRGHTVDESEKPQVSTVDTRGHTTAAGNGPAPWTKRPYVSKESVHGDGAVVALMDVSEILNDLITRYSEDYERARAGEVCE